MGEGEIAVFKAFLNDSAINVTIITSALFLKGFEDSLWVIIWCIKINAILYSAAIAMCSQNRL